MQSLIPTLGTEVVIEIIMRFSPFSLDMLF